MSYPDPATRQALALDPTFNAQVDAAQAQLAQKDPQDILDEMSRSIRHLSFLNDKFAQTSDPAEQARLRGEMVSTHARATACTSAMREKSSQHQASYDRGTKDANDFLEKNPDQEKIQEVIDQARVALDKMLQNQSMGREAKEKKLANYMGAMAVLTQALAQMEPGRHKDADEEDKKDEKIQQRKDNAYREAEEKSKKIMDAAETAGFAKGSLGWIIMKFIATMLEKSDKIRADRQAEEAALGSSVKLNSGKPMAVAGKTDDEKAENIAKIKELFEQMKAADTKTFSGSSISANQPANGLQIIGLAPRAEQAFFDKLVQSGFVQAPQSSATASARAAAPGSTPIGQSPSPTPGSHHRPTTTASSVPPPRPGARSTTAA